jgi:hypothetical protein
LIIFQGQAQLDEAGQVVETTTDSGSTTQNEARPNSNLGSETRTQTSLAEMHQVKEMKKFFLDQNLQFFFVTEIL